MHVAKDSIAVLVNPQKSEAERLSLEMMSKLEDLGWKTHFAKLSDDAVAPLPKNTRMIISLGGDGTVLAAARLAAPLGVPVLPIDLGTLGFIAWVKPEQWLPAFNNAINNVLPTSERMMLNICVVRNTETVATFNALNDAVVSGYGPAKIVTMLVKLNGATLGQYRSDGLIVASPTGSTAYSVSAGGPVLDPHMDAILFTPICPFTLSNRPFVMPGDACVNIYVEKNQRERTILTVDGQSFFDLQEDDIIMVNRSDFRAKIYKREHGEFFTVLREKLNWLGGINA